MILRPLYFCKTWISPLGIKKGRSYLKVCDFRLYSISNVSMWNKWHCIQKEWCQNTLSFVNTNDSRAAKISWCWKSVPINIFSQVTAFGFGICLACLNSYKLKEFSFTSLCSLPNLVPVIWCLLLPSFSVKTTAVAEESEAHAVLDKDVCGSKSTEILQVNEWLGVCLNVYLRSNNSHQRLSHDNGSITWCFL